MAIAFPRSAIAQSAAAKNDSADTTQLTAGRSPAAPSAMEVLLPNGLKAVLLEDHSFPVVSCSTWYRVGSRNELPGSTGITHVLEHLLFGAVGSLRKGEIASNIARIGGQFNGYTSDDFTSFFETVPSNKLELALKVESERMRSANFTDKDVREELSNVQREFENEVTDGPAALSREVRATLYLAHPYHHPTMGSRTDVENLTSQQLKDYYHRYFTPDNCTVVVSGDIQPDVVVHYLQKQFGGLPKAPNAVQQPPKAVEPVQHGERRIIVKYPGKQEALQVAYRAPAFDDPDAPALVVLEKLLNAPLSGRLRTRLVEQKVCASAQSSFEAKKDPGYFQITCNAFSSTPNAQQKILEDVDGIVNQLRTQPISDAELRRSKNLAEFAFFTEQDSPYKAGFHLGYFDTLSKWQSAVTWPAQIRSVTAADVQRVAKKYLNTDSRVVAWLTGGAPAPTAAPVPAPASPKAPEKPAEHNRLTGYKEGDERLSPSSKEQFNYVVSAAQTTRLDRDDNSLLPAAVKEIPAAIGAIPGAAATVLKTGAGAIGNLAIQLGALPVALTKLGSSRYENLPAYRKVLKNGMTLLVFESHLTPMVQMEGAILAGAAYDPPAKNGVSEVVCSLLNQGSSKRGRLQTATLQEDMGLLPPQMIKFSGTADSITFATRCLSRDVETQFGLLSDALITPPVAEGDIEKAKQDVANQLKQSEETNEEKAGRVLIKSLLADSSPFQPAEAIEMARSVPQLATTEVTKFISTHVMPSATTIVVVGDVKPEQLAEIADRAFANWSSKGTHQRVQAHPSQHRVMRASSPTRDRSETIIGFGQLLPIGRTGPDYGNLLIADAVLSNHPLISRLTKTIAEKPELAAALNDKTVETEVTPLSSAVEWSLLAPVQPNAVPMAVQEFQSQLKQLSEDGITQNELNEVKRYLLGALPVRKLSSLNSVADTLLEFSMHAQAGDNLFAELASVKSASVDSVNRTIRSLLKPEEATLVVVGSAQSIRSVRSQVSSPAVPTENVEAAPSR